MINIFLPDSKGNGIKPGTVQSAGTQLGTAAFVEDLAGLFFVPETLGFSILVTAVGILEGFVGAGLVAAGAILIMDGITRVATGKGLFPFAVLDVPAPLRNL